MVLDPPTRQPPQIVKQIAFSDKLQIISININGLRSKIGQNRQFLLNQPVESVLVLNDTRLRGTLKSSDFPGYTIVKKDKPLIGTTATAGGVAIIFPQGWSCIEQSLKLEKDHFEAIAAVLLPPNSVPIKIATCYNRPGNHFPPSLLNEFNDIKLNGVEIPGLFMGDFNSPHVTFGSRLTNAYGSSLLSAINRSSLIHFNNHLPTYICSSSGEPNVLDLVLGNSLICPYFLSCQTVGDIGSDHYPVVTLLDLDVKKAEVKPRVNYTEWVKKIDETLPNLSMDSLSVDDQVDIIENILTSTKRECTHRHRKLLLAQRKRALSQQERAVITKEYNRINNKVKYQIQQFDEEERKSLASDICAAKDTNKMWKLFKKFKTRNKECIEPIAPLELPNGKVTSSNVEKSAEFARHLESVHQTPNDPTCDL